MLTIVIAGCGSAPADDRDVIDAAPEQPPREDNPISLTLWPFWGVPVDENGFGEPEPLGVKVCVAWKRGYEDLWERFVETKGPCIESTAANEPNEKIVLTEVPALSELILTAHELTAAEPRYVPKAFTVVTGQSDQDETVFPDLKQMHLFPRDAFPYVFPGADLERGQLMLIATSWGYVNEELTLSSLGGVKVWLEPASGEPPFYGHGGVVTEGATETPPGGVLSLEESSYGGFTNLLEGEYFVHASHPTAVCYPIVGLWGYPDARPDVIRAPVLPGYFTEVGAGC